MFKLKLLLLVISINLLQTAYTAIDFDAKFPLVQTKSGRVQGKWRQCFEGSRYASFEGIPYAKPPVGELRFEAPQPVNSWTDTWKATKFHECLQLPLGEDSNVIGSEDCLYLNVFVPHHANTTTLDVLVHIHGGGFAWGSGTGFVDPFFVMSKKWVFVTMNYRLGPLGFLSTEDEVVPGNNGLKDQLLALRWIQDNIASFGGNPKSVTLTGFSAGGISTHLHYFSPLSRNLFHKGFSISGTALNSFTQLDGAPLEMVKSLSKTLDCDTSDTSHMVRCLKQQQGENIILKTEEIKTRLMGFGPVIEPDVDGAFLTRHPYKLLKEGKVYDVPWIASHTTEEAIAYISFFSDMKQLSEEDLKKAVQILIDIEGYVPKDKENEVVDKIIEFYLPNGTTLSESNQQNYIKMFTDRISINIEQSVQLQARVTKSPVYHYKFYFRGYNTWQRDLSPKKIVKGACHGDDMVYLFGGLIKKSLNTIESRLRIAMQYMMSTYASTGIPKFPNVDWLPVGDKLHYITIVGSDTMRLNTKTDFSIDKFWSSIGVLKIEHDTNKEFENDKDEL